MRTFEDTHPNHRDGDVRATSVPRERVTTTLVQSTATSPRTKEVVKASLDGSGWRQRPVHHLRSQEPQHSIYHIQLFNDDTTPSRGGAHSYTPPPSLCRASIHLTSEGGEDEEEEKRQGYNMNDVLLCCGMETPGWKLPIPNQ